MNLLKVLFVFLLPSLALTTPLAIGSGVETYKINNAYYVRDLLEVGAHAQPYFHCKRGSPAKVDLKKIRSLEIDGDLLGRKLCDIEMVAPGLAKVLAATINFHSWTFINAPLALQTDDPPIVKFKMVERIQASNRTLFNIRLQSNVWKQLTAQHRIALIFHEVTFTLLKYVCTNEPACSLYKQSPRLAREITGSLFSESTYASESEIKKLNTLIRLSLYTGHPAPKTGERQ